MRKGGKKGVSLQAVEGESGEDIRKQDVGSK